MTTNELRTESGGTIDSIFIVGVSRSGTSLMRRILNKSDRIAICKENHYLGHLLASQGMRHKMRAFGSFSDDKNVRSFVDALYDGTLEATSKLRGLSYQWKWIAENLSRSDFTEQLLSEERTERGAFRAMMTSYAHRR